MATMSARYTVIDGEVIAQERGGVRHQLVPDPVGSTVALYDDSGTKTDTFEYWPYGETKTRTGTTVAKFQYVGAYGYYSDSSTKNYVRARYLDTGKGRWVTEDVIGIFPEYVYANSSSISYIDPSGKLGLSDSLKNACSFINLLKDKNMQQKINACISDVGKNAGVGCDPIANFGCLVGLCAGGVTIGYDVPRTACCGSKPPCAQTYSDKPCKISMCKGSMSQIGCRDIGGDIGIPTEEFNILHEMGHCCGIEHTGSTPIGAPLNWQCNDIAACCIYNLGSSQKCRRHEPKGPIGHAPR